MRFPQRNLLVLCAPTLAILVSSHGVAAEVISDKAYQKEIQPLLQKYCVKCHGKEKGGKLRTFAMCGVVWGSRAMNHATIEELTAGLPAVLAAPDDAGVLNAIVTRPDVDRRESHRTCELSGGGGVHGDRWARACWMSLPNRRPHPDVQVAITSSRVMALIANEDRWPLSGDNLYVDFDLTVGNLPCGQRLLVGNVVLEITQVPHNGCQKFASRFGQDALKFTCVRNDELRLRGVYASVVRDGKVTVGDLVRKA